MNIKVLFKKKLCSLCIWGGLLFSIVLNGCENFLEGTEFKNQVISDIEYAKAESVNFTVLPVNITQGQVTSEVTTAKVGYPVEISFEVNSAYGIFGEWKAYSDYSYNEDTQTILGTLLDDEVVSFDNSCECNTRMTIHNGGYNIRIVPTVVPNPYIWFNAPSYTEENLIYSVGKSIPAGRTAINVNNTISLSAESYSGYAIKNWCIQTPDGQILTDVAAFYNDGNNNSNITKKFFAFSDDFVLSGNPVFTFNAAKISEDQSSSTALVTVNSGTVEGYIFTPVCVTRPKLLSVSPENTQIISQTQTIVFTFNREIKPDTVNVRVRSLSSGDDDFRINNSIYNTPDVSGKKITLTVKNQVAADTHIEITLLSTIADTQEITIGENKSYTFVTNNVQDNEPPVIQSAQLKYFPNLSTTQTTVNYFDSAREAPFTASHTIKTNSGHNFNINISASDENTGNSGISSFKITERVVELTDNMIVSKTDGILNYVSENDDENLYIVPAGGKSLYDSTGTWNGTWLSEQQQARFHKESSYTAGGVINYNAIAIGGVHQISIQAVDGAGNLSEQKDFFVQFAPEDLGSQYFYVLRKYVMEGADVLWMMIKRTAYNNWKNSNVKCMACINDFTEVIDFDNFAWQDESYSVSNVTTEMKSLYWQSKKAKKNTYGDLAVFLVDNYGIPFSVEAYDYRYPGSEDVTFKSFYVTPGNLGDIVLLNKANGKIFIKSPEEFANEESSATPIAVIVYADNRHLWGMGLELSEPLAWCSSSCAGASFNFSDKSLEIYINGDINSGTGASPDADLADDWDVIKKYDPDGASNASLNYPAFNYCLTYGTNVLSLNSDSSNNNIKTLAGEWCLINKYIGYSLGGIYMYLSNSFSLLGVSISTANYWCSSGFATNAVYINSNGKYTSSTTKTTKKYVRPVFDFFDMVK